jgi:metal transporter CNNM
MKPPNLSNQTAVVSCLSCRLLWCMGLLLLAVETTLVESVIENTEEAQAVTYHHLRSSSVGMIASPERSLIPRFLQVDSSECTESCCIATYPCPVEESTNPFASVPFVVQIIIIGVLISLSALFSGLTLGLMSLDKTGLEIVMHGDDVTNARYASDIFPVRENGNLLLCTLLLGNVAVNALLSIMMGDIAGGLIGFLSSTFLIVIFGEIIPQAACSRYALLIGSKTVPLVRVILVLFYPIAAPLAYMLDKLLGAELATIYSSAELMKLLQIHVENEAMDQDTAVAMRGALKYKDTTVKEVMTPLSNTFMLSVDEKLSFETIAKIFKTGYSRIPVYEISTNNVIGLLFVKDLIFIDPEDETRVADFVQIFGRGVHVVWPDDKLGDVLRELKLGKSHMALVRDVNNNDASVDPFYEIKGIITLEDIVEEILGDEIVDETDAFVDGSHAVKVDRTETFKWARLRLLDSKIVDESLSFDEVRAVTAHLKTNYSKVVSPLTEKQLRRLVTETHVSLLPAAVQEVGETLPSDLLYQKGVENDVCTLILSGKVTVLAGDDNFRSNVSSWCLLGSGALSDACYKPDFDAFVSSGPCRCLRINRASFAAAIDISAVENLSSLAEETSDRVDDPVEPRLYPVSRPLAVKSVPVNDGSEISEHRRKKKLLTALQMFGKQAGRNSESATEAANTSVMPSNRVPQPEASNAPEILRYAIEYIESPAQDESDQQGDNGIKHCSNNTSDDTFTP